MQAKNLVRQRREGAIGGRLAFLAHAPVITFGTRIPRQELLRRASIPLADPDRGALA
ncbi:hypothetical protein ACGFYQ_08665 [Streptomyces sp. NPDC048258]|uniref:hypothetical protein n=1 Tax=Streptomyces sp. NPDC048258 TaxID=3365527 RepID=UPI00371CA82A